MAILFKHRSLLQVLSSPVIKHTDDDRAFIAGFLGDSLDTIQPVALDVSNGTFHAAALITGVPVWDDELPHLPVAEFMLGDHFTQTGDLIEQPVASEKAANDNTNTDDNKNDNDPNGHIHNNDEDYNNDTYLSFPYPEQTISDDPNGHVIKLLLCKHRISIVPTILLLPHGHCITATAGSEFSSYQQLGSIDPLYPAIVASWLTTKEHYGSTSLHRIPVIPPKYLSGLPMDTTL